MSEPEFYNPENKKRGLSHLVAATQYSMAGLMKAAGESAFRKEMAAAILVLIAYIWVGAGPVAIIGSLCLFMITFAVEALNTALELVVDRTSPEISQYGKDAKDLGSFAVFCLLVANAIFFGWSMWNALA